MKTIWMAKASDVPLMAIQASGPAPSVIRLPPRYEPIPPTAICMKPTRPDAAPARFGSTLTAPAMPFGTARPLPKVKIAIAPNSVIGDNASNQMTKPMTTLPVIEAEVPKAMAEAFRNGNLGIMDYQRMKNIEADTRMRGQIAAGEEATQQQARDRRSQPGQS